MSLSALTWYRAARWASRRGIPLLPGVLRRVIYLLHSTVLPEDVEIGEGTLFGYGGIGVVIHRDSRIGRHCLISQQVTLGGRSGERGAPIVGDYVRIGAGAKLLGPIRIGDFAVIGANAVVLKDVAPGAVVVGVPAREVRREPDPVEAYTRGMGHPPPGYSPRMRAVS